MNPYIRLALVLVLLSTPALAESGRASGTFTFNGSPTELRHATWYEEENLYDSAKHDTVVLLTDRALEGFAADDVYERKSQAEAGNLVAVAVRLDGKKVISTAVNHRGIQGTVLLPGQWFTFVPSGKTSGKLELARHDTDGHSYACSVTFDAAKYEKPAPPVEEATPEPEPVLTPEPTLPPASTSNIKQATLTQMIIAALMQKDEHQALELIKQGADPNGKDQYGMALLNWAVMTCQPKVVQALVDRKADLTYERAPGMTIMTEAGACPEAAKILKEAGAR